MGIIDRAKERIAMAILGDKNKNLPKKVRDFLTAHSSEPITSIIICREPIAGPIKSILNLATSGQVNKTINANGWDSFFHLWININGKYSVEKNEIITVGKARPGKTEMPIKVPVADVAPEIKDRLTPEQRMKLTPAEREKIQGDRNKALYYKNTGPEGITIGDLFMKAQNGMGEQFFTYDMNNNCQAFILGLLKYSKLATNETRDFIYQDASDVIAALGSKGEAGANWITRTAGKVHQTIQELFMKQGSVVRAKKGKMKMRFK